MPATGKTALVTLEFVMRLLKHPVLKSGCHVFVGSV
jgi:hypothetical protein